MVLPSGGVTRGGQEDSCSRFSLNLECATAGCGLFLKRDCAVSLRITARGRVGRRRGRTVAREPHDVLEGPLVKHVRNVEPPSGQFGMLGKCAESIGSRSLCRRTVWVNWMRDVASLSEQAAKQIVAPTPNPGARRMFRQDNPRTRLGLAEGRMCRLIRVGARDSSRVGRLPLRILTFEVVLLKLSTVGWMFRQRRPGG